MRQVSGGHEDSQVGDTMRMQALVCTGWVITHGSRKCTGECKAKCVFRSSDNLRTRSGRQRSGDSRTTAGQPYRTTKERATMSLWVRGGLELCSVLPDFWLSGV